MPDEQGNLEEVIQVRMTPAQKRLMHLTAVRCGLTDAAFCRQAVLMHIGAVQRQMGGEK